MPARSRLPIRLVLAPAPLLLHGPMLHLVRTIVTSATYRQTSAVSLSFREELFGVGALKRIAAAFAGMALEFLLNRQLGGVQPAIAQV